MAQAESFTPYGAMQVFKGQSYSISNLPTGKTINTIKIVEAPRIWSPDILQDGTQNIKNGKPSYIKRDKRGVRIRVINSEINYGTSISVPALYLEGEEIVMDSDNTYTLFSDCTVEYGYRGN